jgi:fatty acid desaturase
LSIAIDGVSQSAVSSRADRDAATHWKTALTRDEINALLAPNDLLGALTLLRTWGILFGAMALVAIWPNPLTIVLALALIGGQQLGLAVVMHEAAHRTLFSNRRVNDWVGQWLGAYPVWADCETYRPYHLQHHAKTGTAEDPDIGLVRPFPITPASLRRKIWRDLSGQTGLKFARGSWKRTFGRMQHDPAARRAAIGVLAANATLLGILCLVGHPALYALWVVAFLTTNTLVTRIRAIAEHALTPDANDPLNNTRTTLANGWVRTLFAPNGVNYHLEHHLLMTVPHYHLPRMHSLLRERGVLDRACIEERGYLAILRSAASKASPAR